MYQFTIPMALMDFVPVLFFGAAAVLLLRDLYSRMTPTQFALFASGTVNIFFAGFLKALWKLLYAANICNFEALNSFFLPVQSIGFLLAGIGIVLMLTKKKVPTLAVAPAVFSGTMVFIPMMVVGLGAICTCLSILAVKLKAKWVSCFFVLAFLCSMTMGAMASKDGTQAWVNWVEQGINCVGQGMFLCGTLALHRAGLKQ